MMIKKTFCLVVVGDNVLNGADGQQEAVVGVLCHRSQVMGEKKVVHGRKKKSILVVMFHQNYVYIIVLNGYGSLDGREVNNNNNNNAQHIPGNFFNGRARLRPSP